MNIFDWLPHQGTQIVFVLFLSFLVGLEREERKGGDERFAFGGVRTYPLIGLLGYALALLSEGALLPQAVGFTVVAAFLLMSYWHKLIASSSAGVTSEMSGLGIYLVGAFVQREMYWVATTLTVVSILLLELKTALESLARRIDPDDILTFTKFLLLSAVILPLLPDAAYTQVQINPFRTWLVVVAVSAVSYASYVLQRLTRGAGGVLLAAALGGAYSSTVTTVALARRSRAEEHPGLFAGAILVASGMMYLRLAALLALFNQPLMQRLDASFLVLGAAAVGAGWLWSRRRETPGTAVAAGGTSKNPLEMSAALLFAALFVTMLFVTHLAVVNLGARGVYTLAAVMGVTDVDPFIMGLTQSAPALTPVSVAAAGILIATASNNLVKGVYAYALGAPRAGRQGLWLLAVLALAGLLPLLWC